MRVNLKLRRRLYFFLVIVIIISLYVFLNAKIRPTILSLAQARLESVAVKAMNDAVRQTIEDLNYQDLIKVRIDDNNNVSFIQADTIKMNDVATKTALQAQENISNIGQQGVQIPLGTIVGNQLTSGRGPKITIKMEPVGSVTSEYSTEFEDAGINQTRHKIFITLISNLRIIIGATSEQVLVKTQILVSETIIIGDVPNSFMKFDNKDDLLNLLPIQ
jgi:sporulation protein YunB